MKADIHPTWYPEAQVTCQCGNTWTTGATIPEIRTEICSACHPFFTGEQRIVDTEGRVDKFNKRLEQRDQLREQLDAKQEDKAPLDLPLSALGIERRYLRILEENEIIEVGDVLDTLAEEGEAGLTALSGIGQQAIIQLKRNLRARGYEIPENDDDTAEDIEADAE